MELTASGTRYRVNNFLIGNKRSIAKQRFEFMSAYRPVIAIGSSLFILAGASLLDVARMQPQNNQFSGNYSDNSKKGSYLSCNDISFLVACPSIRNGETTSQRVAEAKKPLLVPIRTTE